MRSLALAEAWIWDAAMSLDMGRVSQGTLRRKKGDNAPRASHGQLVGTGNGLDDDVLPLDVVREELLDGTIDQRSDDLVVPPDFARLREESQ
jgi:hypothetical protein